MQHVYLKAHSSLFEFARLVELPCLVLLRENVGKKALPLLLVFPIVLGVCYISFRMNWESLAYSGTLLMLFAFMACKERHESTKRGEIIDPSSRGDSRLALYMPDSMANHVKTRWFEPGFLVAVAIAMGMTGALSGTFALLGVAGAHHYVETVLHHEQLVTSARPVFGQSVEEQLLKVADLLNRQLISEAEYQLKRKSILDQI